MAKYSKEDSFRRRLTRQVSMHTLFSFNNLRLSCKFCDASLILENGDTFPVHRSVLSGSSDYFRILFTTSMHKDDYTKVLLKTIDSSTMDSVLQYIYLRQVDINRDSVTEIMKTADYFCLDGLVQLCHGFIVDCLGPHNCVIIMQFADFYYFDRLRSAAYKYLISEFMTIGEQGDQLVKLTSRDFSEILDDNKLNVKQEEYAWDFLLKWVDQDPKNRVNDIALMMPSIRFGLMDSKYFIETVKEHRYVRNRADCKPYIIETLKFMYDLQLTTNTADSIAPSLARPRYPYEMLFAFGGWSGGSPTAFVESYDTKSDRWTRVYEEDPYGPRAYHGTIVIGLDIYLIGGFDGLEYFNSCRKFNTATKMWQEVAPMNCKRCYVSVALLDGVIYAMGGFDAHQRLSSAEKYDCKRNQWTMIAPMHFQRSDASATVLNGKIYITGGFNGQECLSSVETYNPKTNEWMLIPSMSTRRSGVSCIAYNDNLYVLGGFNGLSRMNTGEKFNPATNQWSPIVEMCNPRSNFAVEVIDEMLFVIGGFNGVTTIAHVECYNSEINEWFEARDMHIFRSALSACVVKDLDNIEEYLPLDRDRLSDEYRRTGDRAAVGHNTVNQAVQIDEHENNENNVDNEDVVFFDT